MVSFIVYIYISIEGLMTHYRPVIVLSPVYAGRVPLLCCVTGKSSNKSDRKFVPPKLGLVLTNPLYSDELSHTDKYNNDGIVHYIF